VLVLLGAFTKSAQVPFHFWLPHAMAAPTPVSAYLHSATMVKAGVFLLARLYPALGGSDAWFWIVGATGLATLAFAAWVAIFQHDLKGLLAYSTISHLGLITLLFGLDARLAVVAGVFHILNHATFKASLFMAAGIIDHECGTRDMRRINGLWKYMPYTALLAMIAAASMAGVPLVNGFLSKEMFFGEALALERGGGLRWIMPLAAVAGGVFSVAYSLRFIHDVFFHGQPIDLPKTPHEPPRWMRIPVEILAVVCVLVGVFPALAMEPLLQIAATGVLGTAPPAFSLAVWHGLNTPAIMSAVALSLGVLLYFLIQYGLDLHSHVHARQTAKRLFDRMLFAVSGSAHALLSRLSQGGLTRSVLLIVVVAGAAGVGPFLLVGGAIGGEGAARPSPMALAVFGLQSVCAISLTFTYRSRLLALILLAVVGLMNALAFAYFSAPDLALTQVSVETATVLLLLLALNYLPPDAPPERSVTRALREFGLAVLVGGGVGWFTWAILTRPFESISGYFLRESVPQGGGANAVNVILVDFRGFDTFGEIAVVAIAALGVAALLHGMRLPARAVDGEGRPFAREFSSTLLALLTRALLPLALMVSLYLFLRGHDAPGGGFVAALVTAVGLVLQYFGSGRRFAQSRLPVDGRVLAASGLLVAAATGAGAWVFDAPFLTSWHGHVRVPGIGEVVLATAMLFDLGVYLTVVGSTMLILTSLGSGGAPSGSGTGR
jgi:multicomponent K+:H+ antiporter subunit A